MWIAFSRRPITLTHKRTHRHLLDYFPWKQQVPGRRRLQALTAVTRAYRSSPERGRFVWLEWRHRSTTIRPIPCIVVFLVSCVRKVADVFLRNQNYRINFPHCRLLVVNIHKFFMWNFSATILCLNRVESGHFFLDFFCQANSRLFFLGGDFLKIYF